MIREGVERQDRKGEKNNDEMKQDTEQIQKGTGRLPCPQMILEKSQENGLEKEDETGYQDFDKQHLFGFPLEEKMTRQDNVGGLESSYLERG